MTLHNVNGRPMLSPALKDRLTDRQRNEAVGATKLAWGQGNEPRAEHDGLFREEAQRDERAVEVEVVNMWRDAVVHIVDVHNSSVWRLAFGQDAPAHQPLHQGN